MTAALARARLIAICHVDTVEAELAEQVRLCNEAVVRFRDAWPAGFQEPRIEF
jgi:hypothetical protein